MALRALLAVLVAGGLSLSCRSRHLESGGEHPQPKAESGALDCIESLKRVTPPAATSIRDVSDALAIVTAEKDFTRLLGAAIFLAQRRADELAGLTDLLVNRQEVGLINSADVRIDSRIDLGDLKGYGHGWVIDDDLFIVAGRANWILRIATCRTLGNVNLKTRTPRLALLRNLWRRQLQGEDLAFKGSDPRAARLPFMSRRALEDAVSELALAQINGASDAQKHLANDLGEATGKAFGADARAWSKWLDSVWHRLYFNWRIPRMEVSAQDDNACPDCGEDRVTLP
jgi:hypothetical protein